MGGGAGSAGNDRKLRCCTETYPDMVMAWARAVRIGLESYTASKNLTAAATSSGASKTS
jgi:hypothetical protein